jgi:hypothetical protein
MIDGKEKRNGKGLKEMLLMMEVKSIRDTVVKIQRSSSVILPGWFVGNVGILEL